VNNVIIILKHIIRRSDNMRTNVEWISSSIILIRIIFSSCYNRDRFWSIVHRFSTLVLVKDGVIRLLRLHRPYLQRFLQRKLEIGCGGIIRGQISENSSPMSRKRNTCIFLRACIHVLYIRVSNLTLLQYSSRNYFWIISHPTLYMALCLIYFLLCKVHRLSLIVQFITLYSHMLILWCVNIFYFVTI